MKQSPEILIFFLLLFGCSNQNRNLVQVKEDIKIDLTNIDSVRENLSGFWIPESGLNNTRVIWLDFYKNINSCSWEEIPFSDKIKSISEIPTRTCRPSLNLLRLNDSVTIQIVSMGGVQNSKIELMTKTKWRINGITYLRHKGYDFLKKNVD